MNGSISSVPLLWTGSCTKCSDGNGSLITPSFAVSLFWKMKKKKLYCIMSLLHVLYREGKRDGKAGNYYSHYNAQLRHAHIMIQIRGQMPRFLFFKTFSASSSSSSKFRFFLCDPSFASSSLSASAEAETLSSSSSSGSSSALSDSEFAEDASSSRLLSSASSLLSSSAR